MAMAPTDTADAGLSDWLLELTIGAMVLLLGVAAWAYTHYSDQRPHQERPNPAWLSVDKMLTQMADGRMVDIKLNLRLAKEHDIEVLEPHMPAFQAVIQEAGTHLNQDELQSAGGAKHFGQLIRDGLNGYLEAHDIPERIQGVAFEEMLLMP